MKIKDNTVNIKTAAKALVKAAGKTEPKVRSKFSQGSLVSLAAGPIESKKNYHHGDLRAALLEAGFRLLEDRNAETLGLREVAREVGVSPTAIYRHFPDKAALMLALAHEGLERLGKVQGRAAKKAGPGRPALIASGLTYVRFADQNPALFRLIFSYVAPISPLDADLDVVSLSMRGLREGIHAAMPSSFSEEEKKAATLHAWSLVHGLAELIIHGHIAKDWKLIEMVVAGADVAYQKKKSLLP
jgi:AcrR family transcriptional regulator